jgi:hypothetical protein
MIKNQNDFNVNCIFILLYIVYIVVLYIVLFIVLYLYCILYIIYCILKKEILPKFCKNLYNL